MDNDGSGDGGLGRVLNDVAQHRRAHEAQAQADADAEEARLKAHASVIIQAVRRQDATASDAVAAFLVKAQTITPTHSIYVGSVKKRRFVPITIETYDEPVYEQAHLIHIWGRDYGENERWGHSVVVRRNGTVIFTHSDSRSRWSGDKTQLSPRVYPGILAFVRGDTADDHPLKPWPLHDSGLERVTPDDVQRTTDWFVEALALYLDGDPQSGDKS
jgi:hypothetical protein